VERLSVLAKIRLIWRSLWIQVLLNYRTMQGAGYLHILWQWLRDSEHRENRARRVSGFMNGHPVFSAFALGAMLRRMSEGDAERDPSEFDRWREQLAGPMGMTGDAMIWERWKPIVFGLGAVACLLSYTTLQINWIVIALSCLLLYNVPLFALRWWALSQGYERGKDLLNLSGHPVLPRLRASLDWLAATTAALIVSSTLFVSLCENSIPHFAAAFIVTFGLRRLRVSLLTSLLAALSIAIGLNYFL
jgi:mannose/fructose/N-acetylgalactosamine-specific phosphotransferase system component IID